MLYGGSRSIFIGVAFFHSFKFRSLFLIGCSFLHYIDTFLGLYKPFRHHLLFSVGCSNGLLMNITTTCPRLQAWSIWMLILWVISCGTSLAFVSFHLFALVPSLPKTIGVEELWIIRVLQICFRMFTVMQWSIICAWESS